MAPPGNKQGLWQSMSLKSFRSLYADLERERKAGRDGDMATRVIAEELDKIGRCLGALMAQQANMQTAVSSKDAKIDARNKAVKSAAGLSATAGLESGEAPSVRQFAERVADPAESILEGHAIQVRPDGTAILASAADPDRFCNAICTGVFLSGGETKIRYVRGGSVVGLVINPLTNNKGVLYLSVENGLFTDNPAESVSLKQIHQCLGAFHQWANPDIEHGRRAFIDFCLSPPSVPLLA